MTRAVALLAAATTSLLAGCVGPAALAAGEDPQPIAAAHVLVTRPFRAVPEPDRFIQAALTAMTEEVVRAGYDWLGVSDTEPEDEDDVRERLADLNARRPGTAAIHLVFVEAPTLVGFGTAYTQITCTVYGPSGAIVLRTELEPPRRRRILDLLLPRLRPDVDGRAWGARVWNEQLTRAFPRRAGV